ncbi:hypothetical protein BP5796_10291 [Coleophoma crateriformis]|uniref:FAD-binding PCMH-type domain-containing protein n=1 Tax=Coleophoma crateriformis TaxID=565419 RepID=A0A3D8QV07_9HELO|nr:hypothetical protein BP5796_10291 [Coleophoma crateriformis]
MYLFLSRAMLIGLLSISSVQASTINWDVLNTTVQGRLHTAKPLAFPCFSVYEGQTSPPDPASCSRIQKNYTSSDFRAQFYSGFTNSQDEICLARAADQCLLDSSVPTDVLAFGANKSCDQGSVSPYYIDVQSVGDVQAAFNFSSATGVSLSIKNSGHDYLGRSSFKGSLALWVRNLRDISRNPAFIPEGCYGVEGTDTITTGAGVNSDEVYRFADQQNVTFVGGYATTIGVSGGWVQGGGHSVLSPVYGLGIDRTVQFKVVTPDGVFRVANSCQNQDLFWALKGGGGGTFGVVMEATHRVDPNTPLTVAYIKYSQNSANIGRWLEIVVENGLQWAKQGWGGHYVASNIISVTPLLNLSEATASMEPAATFARSNNGSVVIEILPSWYSFYIKYVIPNQAPVGTLRFLASRLIPASLFETATGQAKLLSFLNHLVDVGFSPYIPATAPYLFPYAANSTSATPAWRDSIWELGMGAGLAWNSTVAQRQATIDLQRNLTQMAEEMTPGGGSYLNEALPWISDWQASWWGDNYPRLLEIKKKYDPHGLLKCWKCVGFEEQISNTSFPCFSAFGA